MKQFPTSQLCAKISLPRSTSFMKIIQKNTLYARHTKRFYFQLSVDAWTLSFHSDLTNKLRIKLMYLRLSK